MRSQISGPSVEGRTQSHNQRPARKAEQHAARFRWLQLWICGGVLLAIALLVTSISTYFAVSRAVIRDYLRTDLHSQASQIENRARQDSVQTGEQLAAMLSQVLDKSSGRICWIRVQDRDGGTIAMAGPSIQPAFSMEETRIRLRDHRPLFKTIESAGGRILVETLPFFLPPGPLRKMERPVRGQGPRGTIEIAESWGDAHAALGAVRRHLLINSSAALALLSALVLIALRFRSYLQGKELAHQIEIARHVQRDLLPLRNATWMSSRWPAITSRPPESAATSMTPFLSPVRARPSFSATSREEAFQPPS